MRPHTRTYRLSTTAANQQDALRAEVGQAMADLGFQVCYSDELPWEAASAARSMLGYYDERGRGIVCFTYKDLLYKVMNPAYEHLHEDSDFSTDFSPSVDLPGGDAVNIPKNKVFTCSLPIIHHTPRQIKVFRNLKKRKKVRVDY